MAPALSDILRITSPLRMFMFLTFCMGATNLEAQAGGLANEEVEALLEVATQLGKKGWNSNMNLCNQTVLTRKPDDDEVVCSCSIPGGVCHVVGIYLKRQDLNGSLPKAIQKLQYLKELDLWANYLSGPIPPEWADTKLELLSLGVNRLNGTIPSYLGNITTLRSLMLSNCNLSGNFPEYLTRRPQLKFLDLSFNSLSGPLPPSFDNQQKLEKMYLTWNNFTGPIPQWISTRDPSKKPVECPEACSKERYSMHINCGGAAATIGKTIYEADDKPGGAAKYESTGRDWQKSTTGHFWDVNPSSDSYIAQNMSILKMDNSVLCTNASLTPLSLTYYVPCLANGNYTVKLHFAEIVIRGNRSYYSLGRRVFDVYIQNIVVLKDFDIVTIAGGLDKVYIHNWTALVTNGALEIRLHWARKGTTMSPKKGTYGPLISAIDVKSDFDPPNNDRRKRFIIAGAVVLPLFLIFILLSSLWWKGYLGGRKSRDRELVGLDLVTGIFTFRQIKTATNDFDAANKLGEGGFGCVYKGVLSDGTQIAVKQLSAKSKQGNREFVNEIGMISALQHPNLVRLYGCCIEGKQLLLVYEYMENNSLAHVLFGTKEIEARKLDWRTRQRICVNIAKGLVFLHEESTLKIVHRDIKGTKLDTSVNKLDAWWPPEVILIKPLPGGGLQIFKLPLEL